MSHDDSNDARLYRLAQATRILRFCRAAGISDDDLLAGRADFSPISDATGRVVPEATDYRDVVNASCFVATDDSDE